MTNFHLIHFSTAVTIDNLSEIEVPQRPITRRFSRNHMVPENIYRNFSFDKNDVVAVDKNDVVAAVAFNTHFDFN